MIKAERRFPQTEGLAGVRDRLQAVQRQVQELVEKARSAVDAGDYASASMHLDEVAALAKGHQEAKDLQATVAAALATQRREAERSRVVAGAAEAIRRLLEDGRLEEAARSLDETEKRWDEAAELSQLKGRLEQADSDRREAGTLIAEAQERYAVGSYREALEILAQAEPLNPSSRELQELRARSQGALDRQDQGAPSSTRGLLGGLGLVAALVIAVASLIPKEPRVELKPPPSRLTGAIEVTLTSAGRATLDGFELPDGGDRPATVHRFSEVDAGSHTVKIWKSGTAESETRKVTVEERKTTRIEVEVPW